MFHSLADNSTFSIVLISISTLVNIILASLIVLRLVHHQRHIRKLLWTDHGSPYSKVIIICVESSALIVLFSGVYTALVFEQENGSLIPFLLLPHICVGGLDLHDIWSTSKIFQYYSRLSHHSSLSIALLKVARWPQLYIHRSERRPRLASTIQHQNVPVKGEKYNMVFSHSQY